MYTLKVRHRKALNAILAEEGIYNTTSPRQAKNGTIEIYDKVTGVAYTLHSNGYIRHHDNDGCFWSPKRSWQLNRVESYINGYGRKVYERQSANYDEQIVILQNAINRDRGLLAVKKAAEEYNQALNQLRSL
jgi:hypothetical protein